MDKDTKYVKHIHHYKNPTFKVLSAIMVANTDEVWEFKVTDGTFRQWFFNVKVLEPSTEEDYESTKSKRI